MKSFIKVFLFITACTFFAACGNQPTSGTSQESESDTISSSEISVESETFVADLNIATKIELSGNPEDSFIAEEDCYVEGEQVVMYFQKGLTVRGDMLAIIEQVMADLCKTSGLTFDPINQPANLMECRDMYYEPGIFSEVNKDGEKINVLVVSLEGEYIQWASFHNAILDITDFDYDPFRYMVIYHELVHVLQHRSGIMLGGTLDEGYAVYITDKILNEKGTRLWDTAQYFFPASFDENLIWTGEEAFDYEYERGTNYQYGFRFVYFLIDTYGEDIYAKIMDEAANRDFSKGYDPANEEADKAQNTQDMISIVKSQTSEDVFTKFAEWYKNNWETLASEYMTQMESMSSDSSQ